MITVGRKWPAIDPLKIYNRGNPKAWNEFLQLLYDKRDIEGLKKTLYGLQAGITDAATAGLVDAEISDWFIRIQRSLEMTAKKIFRELYPNPLDNPLNATDPDALAHRAAKKRRDEAFEQFLRDARF